MIARPYWRCYYANTDGIVFVVDSADQDRIAASKSELMSMIQEDELRNVPLLILANKQVGVDRPWVNQRHRYPFEALFLGNDQIIVGSSWGAGSGRFIRGHGFSLDQGASLACTMLHGHLWGGP